MKKNIFYIQKKHNPISYKSFSYFYKKKKDDICKGLQFEGNENKLEIRRITDFSKINHDVFSFACISHSILEWFLSHAKNIFTEKMTFLELENKEKIEINSYCEDFLGSNIFLIESNDEIKNEKITFSFLIQEFEDLEVRLQERFNSLLLDLPINFNKKEKKKFLQSKIILAKTHIFSSKILKKFLKEELNVDVFSFDLDYLIPLFPLEMPNKDIFKILKKEVCEFYREKKI